MRSTPSRRSDADPLATKASRANRRAIFESLESRQLLTATVTSAIADLLAHRANPSADSIDLRSKVNDPNIPGTVARFQTSLGDFDLALTDQVTPKTVANFLHYVNTGAYNGTIVHRSVKNFVEQFGGFDIRDLRHHIPTQTPVTSEFNSTTPVSNVRGTIAMALSTPSGSSLPDVNSGNSEWFVNLIDNSSSLDTQKFTVFGHVIGNGMDVVDAMAALPIGKIDKVTGNSALGTVPLQKYPQKAKPPILFRNLVLVKRATSEPGSTYSVTSDNPTLVKPSVVDGHTLQFSYGSGTGVANVTVTVTSFDGSTASDTFAVTVPAASGGLVANNDAPGNVFADTPTVLRPLANDTDSASAINASTLTITQQPAHGAATIDTATGAITYLPASGFTGTDTIKYTVKNAANQTSSAATITLNVQAAPVQVTVGNGGARALNYTEPDGTVVKLSIAGGRAVVTFAGANASVSTAGGVVTVSGADATVAGIVITSSPRASAALSITASGGTDGRAIIGGITSGGNVAAITTTNTRLTGDLTVGSLGVLTLAGADHATLTIGGGRFPVLAIGSAIDTSVVSSSGIAAIRSREWLNSDGVLDSIIAPSIGVLQVSGDFAETLQLSAAGVVGLRSAVIGGNLTGGAWHITGNVGAVRAGSVATSVTFNAANAQALAFRGDVAGTFTLGNRLAALSTTGVFAGGSFTVAGAVDRVSAASAAAAWSLVAGNVGAMRFTGDLAASLTAASIAGLSVGGNLSGVVRTISAFSDTKVQLGRLAVSGALSGAKIIATGNIGAITARSMSFSSVYAGVSAAISTANTLPASLSDILAAASIASLTLANGTTAAPAFINSRVAADTIGPMRLGVIQNDNGGTLHGVTAQTMRALTGTLAAGGKLALGPAPLSNNGTLTSFIASNQIELKDFQIKLLA